MKTLFSVLIPAYNQAAYLRQAIDSVLSQTYKDYELIVIDDGSTDSTPQVLQSYGSRIKVLTEQNLGSAMARNAAASVASGEYLAFLDHDDLLLPTALAVYHRIIRTFPSPSLVVGRMRWFKDEWIEPSESSAIVEVIDFPDYLSKTVSVSISYSVLVIRKSIFDEVGGVRIGAFPTDDYDLMLRLGSYGPCAIVQSPITVAYRSHEGNNHKALGRVVTALLSLIQSEHDNLYPGGSKRLIQRYALIGGAVWWGVKCSWKGRQPAFAWTLLIRGGLMVIVGALRNLYMRLRPPHRRSLASK